jgi:hypothetical protein
VSVQISDDAQEGSSGDSYENDEEEEQLNSLTINVRSSSSFSSSTPVRLRKLNDIYKTYIFCFVEPEYFEQAIGVEVWRNAIEDEINMIVKNETWELIEKLKGKDVVGLKWIYKTKTNLMVRCKSIRLD